MARLQNRCVHNALKLPTMRVERKKQQGIGLIETLAAVGIALIVITSLVSLAVFTLRTSLQSKLSLLGTKRANQQLELVRAFRDENAGDWESVLGGLMNCHPSAVGAKKCYMAGTVVEKSDTGFVENPAQPDELTTYFYASDASDGGALVDGDEVIKISVTVEWKVGASDKAAYNYTYISNWRE